ncbi:DUF1428 domain-containing protein [Sphingomonas sp. HT-1]|uniref:DUF1428 domain-containing protein n=1 Tax=unclassified Sphingomonas TaxID=196159 RepID=UPI0002F44794|nr:MULTISPECIES: DUF1428 domain-containing protein [unclassified Sphingomonas]KTF68867.1 RNA signal recognition particle [Sphingomonas sp. WG]
MAYIDGYVLPVPEENRQAYTDLAQRAADKFLQHGALRVVEAWAKDVPHGETTDFYRATLAAEGEAVVFSWITWPDKATRDAGWELLMADPDMQDCDMPFDGKRMFWGGFEPIVDRGEG